MSIPCDCGFYDRSVTHPCLKFHATTTSHGGPSPPPRGVEDQERALFEKSWREACPKPRDVYDDRFHTRLWSDEESGYADFYTAIGWKLWQAARSQATAGQWRPCAEAPYGETVLARGWGEGKKHYIYELASREKLKTGEQWEAEDGNELWFMPVEFLTLPAPP